MVDLDLRDLEDHSDYPVGSATLRSSSSPFLAIFLNGEGGGARVPALKSCEIQVECCLDCKQCSGFRRQV